MQIYAKQINPNVNTHTRICTKRMESKRNKNLKKEGTNQTEEIREIFPSH